PHGRKEPAVSVTRMPRGDVKWVGLDVAKDAIAVGVLDGSSESAPRLEKIAHDEVSIRRLVSRLRGASPAAGVLRGRLDRLCAAPAVDVDGRRMRGGRAVSGPGRSWRQGQD